MLEMGLLQFAEEAISPPVSGKELMKAIDHLYKSLALISDSKIRISRGFFDGLFMSHDLAEGWFEINSCRLYTETSIILEEYLQPAMGLVNDAKSMIDSLVHWGLGMTPNGRNHILGCLEEAESAIQTVLEEMESWVTICHGDNICPQCGRTYLYGDNFCAGCGHRLGGLPTHH